MGNQPNKRLPDSTETQRQLAESLKELMQNRPLEKISVSDIVKNCGISRNTFYYHFQDKYDLVIWIFRSEVEIWMPAGKLTPENSETEILALMDYFRENYAFYQGALSYDGQNSLREYVDRMLYQRIEMRVKCFLPPIETPEQQQELRSATDFFTSALMGVFFRWMKRGMREEDVEVYHKCVRRMLSGELMEGYHKAWQKEQVG